jgi:threonine dehydrogenase-like Zn-dependent dehydrogenase
MVGLPAGVERWPMEAFFGKNVAFRAGVAPVRAYMDDVGPLVASGALDVSAVASHRFGLDELPAAYEAMDERDCVKAIVVPD